MVFSTVLVKRQTDGWLCRSRCVMSNCDSVIQATNNQKFGLCEALIRIGSWELAKSIMSAVPPFSVVSHKPIAQCLCSLIHFVIEPLYFE